MRASAASGEDGAKKLVDGRPSPTMTIRGSEASVSDGDRAMRAHAPPQRRATISFLISAMALAGFRLFGQVRVQFMMVWQR
jgi:hypothetical protein